MASRRLSKIFSWVSPSSNKKSEGRPSSAEGTPTTIAAAPATTTTATTTKDWSKLPTFDELPMFKEFTGCAWEVWGKEDQLGTVNLLTDEVVKRAAAEEIRTGTSVSLNWPLNFPSKPLFGRKSPEVKMKLREHRITRDDEIHINTQSGTQWDGLRHFGLLAHGIFYNNTTSEKMGPLGVIPLGDPNNIDKDLAHIGVQNWATHGICGRGVLLDMVKYHSSGRDSLSYDPWTTHAISVADLEACAEKQGIKFRQGDILILRVGFMQKYNMVSQEERDALSEKPETLAGIEQSEDMKRFLWNNHFAAIASDQPTLESWPPAPGSQFMHETILGLWGMPIGEFFDVEKLSEICEKTGRYTFFFSSWPLNIIGGCASPPNAAAFF